MLCLSFWRRDNASGVTYWVAKHYQGFSLCALPWVLISTEEVYFHREALSWVTDLIPSQMRKETMEHSHTSILRRAALAFGLLTVSAVPTAVASSEIEYYTFPSIYGGTIDTKQWQGKPYLVVNTASQCAFTKQYASLQKLYDKYRDAGLGMIAVPSDDFNQEFDSDAEVKSFCELNYDIDMPMSETLSVRGQDAHPFFKAVKAESGFAPKWNFNKILIGVDGQVVETWGSLTRPLAAKLTKVIEVELSKSH